MAATDPGVVTRTAPVSTALQALTAAALLLPGLQPAFAQNAEDDSSSVQVSRFSEGRRHTTTDTQAQPLHAYTLEFHASRTLGDGSVLRGSLLQDNWSGATPVTVAPAAFGGNRPVLINGVQGAVISGASPLVNGTLAVNRALQPLQPATLTVNTSNELVMSSASPEVRKQAELEYELHGEGKRHTFGSGYSTEPDFHSWHADWRSRLDFNRQQTSLAVGAGYVHSAVDATLDPALVPYLSVDTSAAAYSRTGNDVSMRGVRTQRTLSLGLTQVLNHDAVLDLGFTLDQSNGLLEHPYKSVGVLFVPPEALAAGANVIQGDMRALPEQRPDSRRQQALAARLVQHVDGLDGALHVNYDVSHDDWGMTSHSIELQWLQPLGSWLLAPRLRWYSQTAADFHAPWLVTPQRFRSIARDTQGRELWHDTAQPSLHYVRTADGTLLDANGKAVDPALVSATPDFVLFSRQALPAYFSSDPRLGGFGVVSAGLGVHYRFDNGLGLEAGLDYYRRASSLQFGGNGDTPYADYHYVSASLALVYEWQRGRPRHVHQSDDAPSSLPMTWTVPASLWPVHSSSTPGTLMAGYRLMLDNPGMTMHMLDLHYAINERWSLMLMPQFMTARALHSTSAAHAQHQTTDREEGAPAETVLASQWQWPANHSSGLWQLTTALGVPMTGIDSWSAQPALAYLQRQGRWQWGGELRGRFANESQSDQLSHQPWRLTELDLWSSRQFTTDVSATLHAVTSNSHDILGSAHRQTLGIGFTVSLFNLPLQFEWLHQVSGSALNAHASGNSIVMSLHLSTL